MSEEDLLKTYINKILLIQSQGRLMSMSEPDLKEIASEVGFTQKDWQRLQAYALNAKKRGEGFMRFRNWERAAEAFEEAIPLKPFDSELLSNIALAYFEQWKSKKNTVCDLDNHCLLHRRW